MLTLLRALCGAALAVLIATGAAAQQPIANDAVFALGNPGAPLTLTEFASMTCPHCAAFHDEVLPNLKAKYIDTGKVHFILREFPLDQLAVIASVTARCAGEERFFPLIEALFRDQEAWATSPNPIESLTQLAGVAGVSQSQFESCLQNQGMIDAVINSRLDAEDAYPIASTPSFVLNGVLLDGSPTWEEFVEILDSALAGTAVAGTGAVAEAGGETGGVNSTYLAIALIIAIVAVVAFFFMRRPRTPGTS